MLSDLRLKAKFNLYIMLHIEIAIVAQKLLIYLETFQFSDKIWTTFVCLHGLFETILVQFFCSWKIWFFLLMLNTFMAYTIIAVNSDTYKKRKCNLRMKLIYFHRWIFNFTLLKGDEKGKKFKHKTEVPFFWLIIIRLLGKE